MTTEAEQYHREARDTLDTYAASLRGLQNFYKHSGLQPHFVDRLIMVYLEKVVADLTSALAGECPEDPSRLKGMPIGQYHCPECGCMLMAGWEEHPHERGCMLGLYDPDKDPEVIALKRAMRLSGLKGTKGGDDNPADAALSGGRPNLDKP